MLEVKVIMGRTIKQCLALYSDDLKLFLSDPEPSLKAALTILNTFACFSGLKLNWTISSIFDSGCRSHCGDGSLTSSAIGIKVTLSWCPDYFASRGLYGFKPAPTSLKQRIQTWKNLPLSLIGKINILKMKVLPVNLFFLHHATLWVPKSYFKRQDGLVTSFLWSPSPPCIGLKVLQEPLGQGGLALPDWYKYCQMVFARR